MVHRKHIDKLRVFVVVNLDRISTLEFYSLKTYQIVYYFIMWRIFYTIVRYAAIRDPLSMVISQHLVGHKLGITEYSKVFNSELVSNAESCQQGFIFCLIVEGFKFETKGTMYTVTLEGHKDDPCSFSIFVEGPIHIELPAQALVGSLFIVLRLPRALHDKIYKCFPFNGYSEDEGDVEQTQLH